MIVISSLVFVGLYLLQGASLAVFLEPGFVDTALFLLKLSMSVAGLPRTWTTVEW